MARVSRYPAEHRYERHPNDSPDYPGSTERARQLRRKYPHISAAQAFSMACIEIRPDRNAGAHLIGFDARQRPVYERTEYGRVRRNAHTKGAAPADVTEPVTPIKPDPVADAAEDAEAESRNPERAEAKLAREILADPERTRAVIHAAIRAHDVLGSGDETPDGDKSSMVARNALRTAFTDWASIADAVSVDWGAQ